MLRPLNIFTLFSPKGIINFHQITYHIQLVGYTLILNLNGEILKIKKNNIHSLNNGNKQSAIGVFSEVLEGVVNSWFLALEAGITETGITDLDSRVRLQGN